MVLVIDNIDGSVPCNKMHTLSVASNCICRLHNNKSILTYRTLLVKQSGLVIKSGCVIWMVKHLKEGCLIVLHKQFLL